MRSISICCGVMAKQKRTPRTKRFMAKAIFEMRTEILGEPSRLMYEERIINVLARDLSSATNKVMKHCLADQWVHIPKREQQRFLGIEYIDDVGVLADNEHFYEYVKVKPKLMVAAPSKKRRK